MKLRHAAALALVGWYIMTPPLNGEPDPSMPISRWYVLKERKEINVQGSPEYVVVLKSEQECKQKLSEELALRKTIFANGGCTVCIHIFENARCISSDNPQFDPVRSGAVPSN
jgi:hypothetical protein